jgi:hypothetical protein
MKLSWNDIPWHSIRYQVLGAPYWMKLSWNVIPWQYQVSGIRCTLLNETVSGIRYQVHLTEWNCVMECHHMTQYQVSGIRCTLLDETVSGIRYQVQLNEWNCHGMSFHDTVSGIKCTLLNETVSWNVILWHSFIQWGAPDTHTHRQECTDIRPQTKWF